MEKVEQKVKFLDVGHGDSSVIYLRDTTGENLKTAIIDISDADKVIAELKKENISVLDILVISHFDADHCKGVNDFLEKFSSIGKVKSICYNIDRRELTKAMRYLLKRFMELYRRQNITILSGMFDTNLQRRELLIDSSSKLSLIYPNKAEDTLASMDNKTNNMSIVCMLENEKCTILFTGDLEAEGWARLMYRMPGLTCDILKMPHHGAFYLNEKGMGTEEILCSLAPHAVIISTGENKRYRHPDLKTIEALKKKAIQIYCTEYTSMCHCSTGDTGRKCFGDIEVIVNHSGYEINTEENGVSFLKTPVCSTI